MVDWIPNAITLSRVALLPVFLLLLSRIPAEAAPLTAWSVERAWPAGVLLAMGATDYLDGWAARRLGVISRIGGIVDAAADRLVLLVPLLYFVLATPAAFPQVGLWIPFWLIAVDLVTGAGWLMARLRHGVRAPLNHNRAGRVATWVFFALLFWIVAGLPPEGVVVLAVAALGLSTVSTAVYLRGWLAGDLDLSTGR
jgi:phosphatidylglycerophosphate synthase